jgi:hypothetical protein
MTRRTKEKERVHARLLDGLRLLLSSWLSPTQRYMVRYVILAITHAQKVEMPITSMDGLAIAAINHRTSDSWLRCQLLVWMVWPLLPLIIERLTLGYSVQRCASDMR